MQLVLADSHFFKNGCCEVYEEKYIVDVKECIINL